MCIYKYQKKRIKLISILKYMRASLEIDDDDDDDGKNNIIYVERN